MLKKRMLTVLAVLLSCAFLFTGCKQNVGTPEDNAVPEEGENADETEEDGTFVFGFTGIDMENPYFITLEKAIREVIEENEYRLVTKDPASDPETQAAQIQEGILDFCRLYLESGVGKYLPRISGRDAAAPACLWMEAERKNTEKEDIQCVLA